MNRGAQLLKQWRVARFANQTAAAAELSLQVSQVSRFETGGAKPGRQLALRLRKRCGVHISAWDEDPLPTPESGSPGRSEDVA